MRPTREHATNTHQTYIVTTSTWERRALFHNERWAKLLIDTLYHYRGSAYLLHAFVVMPEHIHLLITPLTSLEKSVQFIKGGFSHRAKKELGSNMEVWQKGFSDHRIRDAGDYQLHVTYMRANPVRKHLCERTEDYPYSSACPGFELDEVPQGLKPVTRGAAVGAPEGAPFQSKHEATRPEPSKPELGKLEPAKLEPATPKQSKPHQGKPQQSEPVQTKLEESKRANQCSPLQSRSERNSSPVLMKTKGSAA